jgi:hypothetical protein
LWHRLYKINGIPDVARDRKAPISAAQQQVRRICCFFFHMMEFIFNMMIICNIYHTAVRKIHL